MQTGHNCVESHIFGNKHGGKRFSETITLFGKTNKQKKTSSETDNNYRRESPLRWIQLGALLIKKRCSWEVSRQPEKWQKRSINKRINKYKMRWMMLLTVYAETCHLARFRLLICSQTVGFSQSLRVVSRLRSRWQKLCLHTTPQGRGL